MPVVRGETGGLTLGGLDLGSVVRDPALGTPTYVYDLDGIADGARALESAFAGVPHRVAYAVKANSAAPIVRVLSGAGFGADVVSGPELSLALGCGIPADAILFSGVAKTDAEIDAAIAAGARGIAAIQVESLEELPRIAARARALSVGRPARISLRVNPSVDLETMQTHTHIATGHDDAKFGIPKSDVHAALSIALASPELSLAGLSTHVGSQLTSTRSYLDAARALFELVGELRPTIGDSLRFVDTGGGFGIDYGDGCPVSPADFIRETRALQTAMGLSDLALYVEPGRALVAAHGVLLARVLQHKVSPPGPPAAARQRWLMIDAGMNDLLRPALYQARHRVVGLDGPLPSADDLPWRVVGPVCESSDDFGAHLLPGSPPQAVAILDAGAYGYTMASRYNGRPLPAEVFVSRGRVVASRPRQGADDWTRDRLSLGA
jgi:diaminopimelate decarboxylase